MKSTKLILGLALFLIICISVNAVVEYPPYTNEFYGNTNWISESDTRSLTGANNTYCQPFVAYTSGTVEKIFTQFSNSGATVNWCLYSSTSYPNEACLGNGGSFVGVGVDFNDNGQDVNLSVIRGNTYYLCLQGDTSAGGSATVNVGDKDFYSGTDDAGIFSGITTPYNPLWVEGYQSNQGAEYSFEVNGSQTGFTSTDYVFRSFQYCMDNTTDQCHVYSGASDNNANGEGLNEFSGEAFQYVPITSSLEEVNFMMMHGTGILGYTYKVEVYEWNQTTNTTGTLLYNSTAIADNNANWTTGYLWSNHTVTASFNLVEDKYYLIGAKCVSGCSGSLNQKMHLAYSNWRTTTDWFVRGFQDTYGLRYDDEISGDHLEPSKDTFFLLKMGDAIRTTPTIECNDTLDNDGDGYIDYPADPSCDNVTDNSEAPFDYQCDDGVDNDGDGWTDYPFDPQCVNATDHNESPYDYDCDDGYDNDGDYYFDYPADPSCDNATDDSEEPIDNPQCDDGVDNDLDGFTDYPADPSCSSAIDNDESPADFSEQPEDDCFESLQCLIYDSIPYADSPFLHTWFGGQESDAQTVSFVGGYSVDLDTIDDLSIKENVIIYKNISHINNYNNIYGQFALSILEEDTGSPISSEPIYVGFMDYNQNGLVRALLNVSTSATAYDLEADLYVYDADHWEFVATLYTDDSDSGFIRLEFDIDEVNNDFQIQYTDITGITDVSTTYDYDTSGSGEIYMAMVTNTLDRNDSQVLLNLVELTGIDIGDFFTVCTTWDLPYHLKENFNGYMGECGWNVNPDIFFYAKLSIENEIDDFMIYRIFDDDQDDAIYYDRSRYATIKFNLNLFDDSDSAYALNLFVYDLAFSNAFIRLYFMANGSVDATVRGDNYNIYHPITFNSSKEVMIVVDLTEDTFDFYYDGVLRDSNIEFYDEFLNIKYLNGIYIQSTESHYEIDDLQVYESDDDAVPNPNVGVPVELPDETKAWCELFNKVQPPCTVDDDCETGVCMTNNKCSSFDFTWCDENQHTRGNKCIVAGMASCTLTSAGGMILDNFFLFLIFLIILLILVYMVIMFRK